MSPKSYMFAVPRLTLSTSILVCITIAFSQEHVFIHLSRTYFYVCNRGLEAAFRQATLLLNLIHGEARGFIWEGHGGTHSFSEFLLGRQVVLTGARLDLLNTQLVGQNRCNDV